MKWSTELDGVNISNDSNFFTTIEQCSKPYSISELWTALKSKVGLTSSQVSLTCADIAMCAGDTDEAFRRYADWTESYTGASAFLPFTRTRISIPQLIEPMLPRFFSMASADDGIHRLVGIGALFSLGKWAELDELCDGRAESTEVDWRIAAAVGLAKMFNHDYTKAAAFFVPAVLQGRGSAVPHDGRHRSIDHAAEDCSVIARQYIYAARLAERTLIAKDFHKQDSAAPLDLSKIDLFIKTCAKDEEFLVYCLKSIDLFVSKFRQIVIVTDEDHDCHFDLKYNHIVRKIAVPDVPTTFDMSAGYRMQMVVKLSWMDYTDADAVVITDSDTIFTRPFAPQDMFVDEKPIWYYGEWHEGLVWRAGTELVVGAPMPFCCMREHPFIFSREATAGFLSYIDKRFNCSISDLFFAGKIPGKMCEFEILGGYLAHISSHGYSIRPHQYMGIVRQYWSWGGFTDDVKNNIEEHLRKGFVHGGT